jgi:hypothetical protein
MKRTKFVRGSRYFGFPVYQKVLEQGARRCFSLFHLIAILGVASIAAPVILRLLGVL